MDHRCSSGSTFFLNFSPQRHSPQPHIISEPLPRIICITGCHCSYNTGTPPTLSYSTSRYEVPVSSSVTWKLNVDVMRHSRDVDACPYSSKISSGKNQLQHIKPPANPDQSQPCPLCCFPDTPNLGVRSQTR